MSNTLRPFNVSFPDFSFEAQQELRKLRVWHWQQVTFHRKKSRSILLDVQQTHEALAAFHLKAVQALNITVSGTAEQDEAEGL